MQAHILIERLASYFILPHQILLLRSNFLPARVQHVIVNGNMSQAIISSILVLLSPLLSLSPLTPAFITYTDSCRSSQQGSFLVKFSYDTALLSLLQGSQSTHGRALSSFSKWCDDNLLDHNVVKTKELIIDFRKNRGESNASIIHGEEVQTVDTYKYLGTII